MKSALILIDRPAEHVCRIRINRPEKLNALDFGVRDEMLAALPAILSDDTVRALLLGGAQGNLSAGGDVPSMQGLSAEQARERMEHIHRRCRLVANADIPIVTAAEGICAGGAVGLALLGDFTVGDAGTRIMIPFFKLGLVPDWGMMRSLPQRVGLPRARQMIMEAQTVEGNEAHRIGLLDFLADEGDAMPLAIRKASALAAQPGHALAMVKRRLRQPGSFEDDLSREVEDQIAGLTGKEFAEGFAAYSEKRRANFLGIA